MWNWLLNWAFCTIQWNFRTLWFLVFLSTSQCKIALNDHSIQKCNFEVWDPTQCVLGSRGPVYKFRFNLENSTFLLFQWSLLTSSPTPSRHGPSHPSTFSTVVLHPSISLAISVLRFMREDKVHPSARGGIYPILHGCEILTKTAFLWFNGFHILLWQITNGNAYQWWILRNMKTSESEKFGPFWPNLKFTFRKVIAKTWKVNEKIFLTVHCTKIMQIAKRQ